MENLRRLILKKIIITVLIIAVSIIVMPFSLLISDEDDSGNSSNLEYSNQANEFGIKLRFIRSGTNSNYMERKPELFLINDRETLDNFKDIYFGSNIRPDYKFDIDLSSEELITIFMGQKSSGGYSIGVEKEAIIDDGILNINAILNTPPAGAIVTMQITSPYIMVAIPKESIGYFNEIKLINQENSKTLINKTITEARFLQPPDIDQPEPDVHPEFKVEPVNNGGFCLYEVAKPKLMLIDNEDEFQKVSDIYFSYLREEDWIMKVVDVNFKDEALVLLMLGKDTKLGNYVEIDDTAYLQGKVIRLTADISLRRETGLIVREANSPYAFASLPKKFLNQVDTIKIYTDKNQEIASVQVSNTKTIDSGNGSSGVVGENPVSSGSERTIKFEELASGAYSSYSGRDPLIVVAKEDPDLKSISDEYFKNVLNHEFDFDINFDKKTVIGLFQGEKSSGGFSIIPKKVKLEDNRLTIVCEMRKPEGISTMAITSPYAIISVDKKELREIEVVVIESEENGKTLAKTGM